MKSEDQTVVYNSVTGVDQGYMPVRRSLLLMWLLAAYTVFLPGVFMSGATPTFGPK